MGRIDFAPVSFLFEAQDLVRILPRGNDELWFVATDVWRILWLSNTTTALKALDAEAGLYKLIGRSRKPAARRFDRFIRHEILATIRRTGRFAMDAAPTKLNAQAVNAVSRAVGEVRRSLGPRAAAKAGTRIFHKASDQGKLGLGEPEPPEDG